MDFLKPVISVMDLWLYLLIKKVVIVHRPNVLHAKEMKLNFVLHVYVNTDLRLTEDLVLKLPLFQKLEIESRLSLVLLH